MRIFIFPSFLLRLKEIKNQPGSYPLYGKVYDDFTVCHLTGISKSDGSDQLLGLFTLQEERKQNTPDYPYLHV